jgi:hypothetical protein
MPPRMQPLMATLQRLQMAWADALVARFDQLPPDQQLSVILGVPVEALPTFESPLDAGTLTVYRELFRSVEYPFGGSPREVRAWEARGRQSFARYVATHPHAPLVGRILEACMQPEGCST